MEHKPKYTFSFTGASALIFETIVVAEEYNKFMDWEKVYKSLSEKNLLNKIKQSTVKRQLQEIVKRISALTNAQINILVHGDLADAKAIILLSLAKVYPLIYDFIVEVVRSKYQLFDKILTETDFNTFFNAKSISHRELEELSETTASKVKQRVFTILEQVGLITHTKNGSILKPMLNNNVLDVIVEDDPTMLNAFLFSNEEIKSLLQKLKHA